MTQVPSTVNMTRAFLSCAILSSIPPMIYMMAIVPIEDWWRVVVSAPLSLFVSLWAFFTENFGPAVGQPIGFVIALISVYSILSLLAAAHVRGWRPWAMVAAFVLGILNAAVLPYLIRAALEK